MIRIKIAEEMDLPHRQHTAALEGEIEKFRNMYYQLRRDHELFKSQQEALQVFFIYIGYFVLATGRWC